MTAQDVLDALASVHMMERWVTYRECWRIDLFALGCVESSTDYRRVGYEVKVSMSDLRAELRKPEKRQPALDLTHQMYFAVPEAMGEAALGLVPDECGLVVVHGRRDRHAPRSIAKGALSTGRVTLLRRAPIREPREFTPREIAYLARFQHYREKHIEKVRELEHELWRLRHEVGGA